MQKNATVINYVRRPELFAKTIQSVLLSRTGVVSSSTVLLSHSSKIRYPIQDISARSRVQIARASSLFIAHNDSSPDSCHLCSQDSKGSQVIEQSKESEERLWQKVERHQEVRQHTHYVKDHSTPKQETDSVTQADVTAEVLEEAGDIPNPV